MPISYIPYHVYNSLLQRNYEESACMIWSWFAWYDIPGVVRERWTSNYMIMVVICSQHIWGLLQCSIRSLITCPGGQLLEVMWINQLYWVTQNYTDTHRDNEIRYDATWRHQMETFSATPAFCVGNSPFTGEFPAQRPVKRSFDVFFDPRLE